MCIISVAGANFVVDSLAHLYVVERIVELAIVNSNAEGLGYCSLLEILHVGALFGEIGRCHNHHVYAIRSEPRAKEFIVVLDKPCTEKLIVERGVVVAHKKKLVFLVVAVDIL